MDLQGALTVTPQISPDGLFWCNEGREPLLIREPGMYSLALREFGGWLRLHGEVTGDQATTKVATSSTESLTDCHSESFAVVCVRKSPARLDKAESNGVLNT